MSVLTDLIYGGSNAVAGLTENAVKEAIAKHGEDKKVAMPDTAYFLPTIYAATGVKVSKLGDLPACVGVLKSLITNKEDLGDALNAGLATAVGAEIIEALKYVESADPYGEDSGIGFVPDPIIRSLGVPLVTGDIPGVAVVLGKADDAANVVDVVKDYQSKGIMTFLIGDVIEQCVEGGVKIGLDFRVVPLGHDVTSVIHVVTVAIRAALIFGNVTPGDLPGLLAYTKERVPAFVNTFGALNEVVVSAGAGAIALGFPVVADVDLGENQVPGALESVTDHSMTVKKSLELRNIKIKVKELPIPVAFASAFEGEIIRKGDMQVEFSSHKQPTCELVQTRADGEVEDHKITIVGGDLDELEAGGTYALATFVEVAGAKMQSDFESVIERKIHAWFNYMEGVMHTGQRNQIRVRINKEAFEKGLRLTHFAEVLYAMIMDEFDIVVDKCQITMVTDAAKVQEILDGTAMPAYASRDQRLESLTDESVDVFYTCTLCQSFAPSHCCVVTPERLGLCGAVSWLDAKATKELTPTGPCQPISKEGCEDETKGVYPDVNRMVEQATQGALTKVTLYSIMEDPMTSCGCFECICGIEPFSNGVIIANREYAGMTPLGMTFGELASMTGGGVQTPGFMGHGRHFIASKKFMSAEGGFERIVWMPKELKDDVAERLNKSAKEKYGIDNFCDMIADETIATDEETLMAFLTEKSHPVLGLDPIM
ncbi:MAG: CO dehydrogenase/CO-methylating acetyl-CoA synthase complex subunit beta [Lachnospiraceae bacterium]|jgi:acetyl-CoA synthase|uniref:acetyl-CoA decarbonylase/synthase complex subunit alpha/beta n=1 Tax=Candidatus Merdisoma sp. JLR.KK011 TaxID=3114299 RepID=UPI001434E907|nr:CO dehydrogenase/CO-methylating acetyl-CoA synthase complex subunit beta [Lachnospiraceae bacterium]MCI9479814.1 CO dehydrogenase/CO-methylating acetyl-CoA synthase complex subunit beta [Lachnospiraceae bacterium]MCI9624547.1 CO dehydrogenase/CO-methylating acetyl-CoA synthase complex subunit beta [Lachnospiraceae bacterium]GFI11694.1 carbon monoxide dehydrogenase/acetyl-CoA synthase subunit alpha [Lachnospiraceae bacterium]